MADHFYTIETAVSTEVKVKGSRFIGFAYPFNEKANLKQTIKALKDIHPKASHFCFGYRIGNDGNNFRSSDDGEPAGTAGKPILGQIDSKEVTDLLIVVVRYFGGTLLGVPGLIDAYKTTAALLLQLTPIVRKNITVKLTVECNYNELNTVINLLKKFESASITIEQGLFCRITALAEKETLDQLKYHLANVNTVEIC